MKKLARIHHFCKADPIDPIKAPIQSVVLVFDQELPNSEGLSWALRADRLYSDQAESIVRVLRNVLPQAVRMRLVAVMLKDEAGFYRGI